MGCQNIREVTSYIVEPPSCKDLFSEETYRQGVLYIPAGTKDYYTRFDGWREFLKIVEMDSSEEPIYLTLQSGSHGKIKMVVKKGEKYTFLLDPENGWRINSVTYNDNDVTNQLDDENKFTTPDITSDAVLRVVFEQLNTRVSDADAQNVCVRAVRGGVWVDNVCPGSICQIYQTSGSLLKAVTIIDSPTFVSLSEGQAYIVNVGGKTLKVMQ